MPEVRRISVALTIAGSDSGGGAGIQADLKTFAALGIHGTTAVTCITAQSPARVREMMPVPPGMVKRQIAEVFDQLSPDAVKTGMLFSAAIVRVVAEFFARKGRPPLIVDPVMLATSGARLLRRSALGSLERLLLCATLVTPNLSEAEVLTRRRLKEPEDLRAAAKHIHRRYGCAALVKGGHLRGVHEAIDFFYDGETELMLRSPLAKGIRTHGTGCTYSAAVAAYLARGYDLVHAVQLAKEYISRAIFQSSSVRGYSILGSFPEKMKP